MIFDKRKDPVSARTTRRCRRTGVLITNRIERNDDNAPPVIEHVTMESAEVYERRAVIVRGVS